MTFFDPDTHLDEILGIGTDHVSESDSDSSNDSNIEVVSTMNEEDLHELLSLSTILHPDCDDEDMEEQPVNEQFELVSANEDHDAFLEHTELQSSISSSLVTSSSVKITTTTTSLIRSVEDDRQDPKSKKDDSGQ